MDRRILLFGRPPVPQNWKTLIIYTASANWIVPKSGWYRIHVIGRGGNGGNGGRLKDTWGNWMEDDSYSGNSYGDTAGAGGGGGGGGYAVSVLYLKKGQQISITVSTNITLVHPEGSMIANRGNNGGVGGSSAVYSITEDKGTGGGSSGTGGSAAGGNLINTVGNSGGAGTAIANTVGGSTSGGPVPSTGGGGGGINGILLSVSYGVGGNGGRGGYTYRVSQDRNKYSDFVSGSAGSGGAVVIEDKA